jgi:hypothetical protein
MISYLLLAAVVFSFGVLCGAYVSYKANEVKEERSTNVQKMVEALPHEFECECYLCLKEIEERKKNAEDFNARTNGNNVIRLQK